MPEPLSKRPRRPASDAKPTSRAATKAGTSAASLDADALMQAMRQLLEPVASLAIARGVPFASLEDALKIAFLDAARAAHANLPPHRIVSRLSTATGINRREVTRLTAARDEPPAPRSSPATRVFTQWLAAPTLKARNGRARPLPRQGPAPSFEALAQSVTRDVHARSLLDELIRLGLVRLDDDDTVHLLQDSFVPKDDSVRMLGFLGANVGDHLRAAVANVLAHETPPHLEQAVFADALSNASLETLRTQMRAHWKTLLDTTVPLLQRLIDADLEAGRPRDQRVRIGLYTYSAAMTHPATTPDVSAEIASNEEAAAPRSGTQHKTASRPAPARAKPTRRPR